jgi:hypothetical protein
MRHRYRGVYRRLRIGSLIELGILGELSEHVIYPLVTPIQGCASLPPLPRFRMDL